MTSNKMNRFTKKAVITGMGIICSIGSNRKEVYKSIEKAECGIREVKTLNLDKLTTQVGGEVKDYSFDFSEEIKDRTAQFAYIAMLEAISDSGLNIRNENPYRCALCFGTCNGNILTLEELYENSLANIKELNSIYQSHYIAIDYLNKKFGICGPKIIFVTACAASNQAIGYAYDLIMTNQADVVFVGGADSFAKTTFGGFHSLQSLSQFECSPFSERIGISLGEGACFMIIESEEHAKGRNAKIHAEVLGYSFCGDAYHSTSPDITGDGAIRAMRGSIEAARIDKERIAYICAHGTGTEANDKTESMAINNYFANHANQLYITATKSLYGHTLGAAGIMQAVISIDCMNNNLIPPIVNFTKNREGCDLNYVRNKPIEKKYDYFLSNSFAFGGNNVSVVFGKGRNDIGDGANIFDKEMKIAITGIGFVTPFTEEKNSFINLAKNNSIYRNSKQIIRFEDFLLTSPAFKRFKKIPRISQFAIQAVDKSLSDANYKIEDGTEIGILWGVAKGPLKVFEKYYQGMMNDGIEFASALYFPHIVLNSVAGQVSIAFGIKGCNTTVAGQFSPFIGLQYASQLIRQHKQEIFIVGGADEISLFDERMMKEKDYEGEYISEGAAACIVESEEHAKNRNAHIYAIIDGFSVTSSYYDKNIFESYKKCIENTLSITNLLEGEIDLHIPCQFGHSLPELKNIVNIKQIANTQGIVGTLESATAILNTIMGIIALENGFAPRNDAENELYQMDFKNILISGASLNGIYYSFILRKPSF